MLPAAPILVVLGQLLTDPAWHNRHDEKDAKTANPFTDSTGQDLPNILWPCSQRAYDCGTELPHIGPRIVSLPVHLVAQSRARAGRESQAFFRRGRGDGRFGRRQKHDARCCRRLVRNQRRHASQLPLRLGGTRQDLRLPGTVCSGGARPQQQGRASRLRSQGPSCHSHA